MVEQLTFNQRVTGSNPVALTTLSINITNLCEGPIYKQPRVDIRPRPQNSMDGRIYSVATSEQSVESLAKLGDIRMVMFADRLWEMRAPFLNKGKEIHQKYHGGPAPTPMVTDFAICAHSNDQAEEGARKYQGLCTESNFYA